MKCRKCGFEWQSYGEALTCPACGAQAALTQSEKQTLWEEVYEAEQIKDYALSAKCYHTLAEVGDEKAAYAYAECLRRGVGVKASVDEAIYWYRSSARRLYSAAAYRLALLLDDGRFVDGKKQSFFWLRVAAELGDVNAAVRIADVYETGDGIQPSHRHAMFWLTRAAKAGSDDACYTLARIYLDGVGAEKNPAAARYFIKSAKTLGVKARLLSLRLGGGVSAEPAEIVLATREEERISLALEAETAGEDGIAASLYFHAARAGSIDATYRLGLLYAEGRGVPASLAEARRRFAVAARAGHTDATLRIAKYLEEGIGGEADPTSALACYEQLEKNGVAEGAFLLGEAYRAGRGVDVDLPTAIRHYKTARSLGYEKADVALEALKTTATAVYDRALSLEARGDVAAAMNDYRTAAAMGHAGASFAMGVLLERVARKPAERKEVFTYYSAAAEGGHIGGIYRLGLCYSRGYGVARNYEHAKGLLGIAEKRSFDGAKEELARIKAGKYRRVARRLYSVSSVLYRKGEVAEALKFRTAAARLGSARAMYVLGCHLEFGDGVPADRLKASGWYTRASEAGFDPARTDLKGGFLRARKKLLLTRRNSAT